LPRPRGRVPRRPADRRCEPGGQRSTGVSCVSADAQVAGQRRARTSTPSPRTEGVTLVTEEPQEGRIQEPAAAAVPGAEIGSGPHSRDHQREAVSAHEKSQADPKRTAGSSADERDLIERLEAEWPALASGPLLGGCASGRSKNRCSRVATPQQLLRQLRGACGPPPRGRRNPGGAAAAGADGSARRPGQPQALLPD
jgi:hypothetical protein